MTSALSFGHMDLPLHVLQHRLQDHKSQDNTKLEAQKGNKIELWSITGTLENVMEF